MRSRIKRLLNLLLLFGCLVASSSRADITLEDDIGQKIHLQKPAQRVISLAPHITELLFDAGATDQVKGTVSFSDYPEQAKHIPRIGTYNKFDLEAIVAIQPDLIIAWEEGNNMTRIKEVMGLGFPVFVNEPRSYEDIEESIRKMGVMLGTETTANARAEHFIHMLNKLKQNNRHKEAVDVFYQVWDQPLFTVNGQHLISKVIEFCSGKNVFEEVSILSPQISIESVLQRNPEVIVAGMAEGREHWLDEWKKWSGIKAVQNRHLYAINADLIVRHTPRILQGTEAMCELLDRVRQQRVSGK